MKVSEVKLYEENVMPKPFNDMMIAFVNGMDDTNSTFRALKSHFKGDINYEKIDNVPFSSERKWSSISFKEEGSVIVGAPERLFEKADKKMPERIIELQKTEKEYWQ